MDKKPNIQLQEFFVEGKSRDTSHVLLHITEPNTPAEKKIGYFFAIAEIEQGTIEQIQHIQAMIDDLESGVYETDTTEEKSSLEITLEYINRRGHHILDFDGVSHIIVGTILNGNIQFAYHGNSAAYLTFTESANTTRCINILADETGSDTQLFSAVLEGNLNIGDYFFVATPHVLEKIGEQKLTNLLSGGPVKQIATTIDSLLQNDIGEKSFGGIVVHAVAANVQDTPPKQATNISQTMPQKKQLSEKFSFPKKKTAAKHRSRQTNNQNQPTLGNQMLVLFGKGLVIVSKFIFTLLLQIIVILKDFFINIFLLITNAGGQRQYVLDGVKRSIDRKKQSYTHLPIISKVLLFATIFVALVFIGSIFFLRAKEAKEVELATYTNTVQAIMDKKDAAESSLIYDDSERAFTLLDEARTLITTLPEKTDEQQMTKSNLTEDIEALLVSLRNITIVTPEIVANLADINTEVKTTALVRIGDSLIAYGPDDATHYVINMNTQATETRDHSTITPLLASDAPKEYDYVSFFTGPTALATLNPEGYTISQASIGAPIETSLLDLAIYNRRAYTLSPSTNQIYKHGPTQTGFDGGTAWVDTTVDLSNAIAITIDGDIYVLKSTGEIMKFYGGSPQPFGVSGVDPALKNPTDIWTYADVDYIYVLEPSQNRLVALNKDGSLSAQYTAENWNNPEAFAINDETNEIYILDDNVIYRFSTRS